MLLSFGLALVVSVILMQVATFSTTIYLHRTATHKALTLHPAVEWMFKFALWLTTGLFHLMVENHLDDLRGLRQLLTGGDVMSVSHAKSVFE